tara:strand:+ start:34 stop:1080 length:1047 start_codon:yes stop_codon:yes gene_type:complete
MAKFNYKKWVLENKYGKSPLDNLTTQPEEDKWEDKVSEIEKDPDAQAAAPKGGEGEKEEKPELDAAAITNQTSYGELSGEEDAKKILTQLQSRDPNQPIYKAMVFTDKKGKTVNPDPEKIANWVDEKGVETLAKRMVGIGNKIKGDLGLPKKDMPFLPGPPDAKGKVSDVGDALSPGGKYNVDVKEETLNEKVPPPAPNTFIGMDDKAAQDYMDSGNQDGDPKDDNVTVEPGDSKPASDLYPTQTNILIAKSIGMAANGVEGGNIEAWIGTDGAILDGHHRWAATMLNNPGASIGYAGAVDMSALGMKPTLKHLTAIGNALGNKTKTAENKDPRSSLYERMEKLINKN